MVTDAATQPSSTNDAQMSNLAEAELRCNRTAQRSDQVSPLDTTRSGRRALRAIPQAAPLAAAECATIFDARNSRKWRTGCEERVSVVKRRHGVSRCRYKGTVGLTRWVGLGVIADNLINIGRVMRRRSPNKFLAHLIF
jgi:hypothetical protein